MISSIKNRINAILHRTPPEGLSFDNWLQVKALPGMVSTGERRELYNYSRLSSGDIVEFGSFFGSSTGALASGLIKRSKSISHSKVYAYDAFESEFSHGFTRHVIERAERYGLSHFIETDERKVSWRKLAEKVLSPWQNQIEINQIIVESGRAIPKLPEKIGLLHLDMPKDLATITPIAEQVFSRCELNSIIAFQDYYYHFSGDLIAFFHFLEDRDYLSLEKSEGCTAFFRIKSSLSGDLILKFAQSTDILKTLSAAKEKCLKSSCTSHQKVSVLMAFLETKIRLNSDCSSLTILQGEVSSLFAQSLRLDKAVALKCLSEILTERVVALNRNNFQ